MKKQEIKGRVLGNAAIATGVYRMEVEVPGKAAPGCFYMLRAWDNEPLLSRPISIGRQTENSVIFYYLIVGRGTQRLAEVKEGETITLFGPLGNGFSLETGKIALVGGGIGIAPLMELSHQLDTAPDVFLGFRDETYGEDEFKAASLQVATESGATGHKGFVTELFDAKDYDVIYACGPTPMLRALQHKVGDDAKLYLSLEAHMACGVGACLGCTVASGDTYKRVCKEGPVFLSEEVQL